METGKLGFVQTAVPEGSVAVTAAAAVHETAAAAERMHVQAPLTTFYVRPMTRSPQPLGPLPPPPLLPPMVTQVQPAPAQLQAASLQEAPAITLPISALNGKQPLPLLALHIAGGVPLATAQTLKTGGAVMPMGAAMCPSKSPKSVGKHVCPYCGRDCLKPSVLEKHLRCHTGERPYPCTICGVSFKTQSNLYKHKRTQAHARISSESDRGSLSSQDSLHSSRDTCFSSSISLDAQTPDYGSQDGYEFAAKQHLETVAESESVQAHPAQRDTQGSGTVRALQQAAMVGLIAAPVEVQKEVFTSQSNQVEPPGGGGVITAGRDPKRLAVGEGTRPCGGSPLTPNRHLPLQRQEATLSPKSWDSMSISKGKSQSHDSTDSGFSDSGEHHWTSSPGSSPHEHSMESLMESSMEVADPQPVSPVETDQASAGGSKSKVSVQEKKQLEERISKIISKNDALMDDKHLENVRPRKTVLSKQGSIDLPMPYTYKDSFHFEMKSAANTSSSITTPKQASISPGPDRRGIQAFCNSLPSQHAGSLDHTPLTRSSSLPFTASEQQSEIPVMASPHHTDRVTLSRRSSAGHLHSLKLGAQSMDQQGPSHRSLVRQAAVDCLPEVSPTERGSLSSLSSDTDCTDTAGESPTARKCRRKRSQKFDYNKWYVYGDGTFRKLYSTSSEKEPDPSLLKAQKSLTNSLEQHDEREDIQISQVRDLVSGTQVVVSTTNMTVGTMQSILCPSIGPGVGLAPASTTCSDRRHSMNAASYVLLQGAMLKNAGSSQQHTDSRVILSGDVFLPKGSSIDRTNSEVVPQHNTLPSERKKQRTEENVCVVLDSMDTGTREDGVVAYKIGQTDGDVTNGVNQTLAPAGRERSRPRVQRQDSLVYPHITQRQPLQKRHSSPLFAVNVSKPSELIIASSANTTTTTTTTTSLLPKSSFLPKYQLKLPQTSGNGESCPRHPAPAPYMRHSFSSSQIFTTCAPRSGHSDSITSFTTLTQSQPITPITHIHSQQSKSNGNTRLNALGLPVPISTWSPSPTAVGGLPHNFSVPALGVACPTQGLRTTSDTPWTPQTLAMVTPGVPGQSYMCKTVLAQDQFGSITAPRHSQSATPVISQNQTTPTGKFCPEQCAKSFADINDTGKPMAVQGRIQQMAVVTVLAQKPTATPTAVFSTNRLIKSVSGVTLDQTAQLLPGQYHSQKETPQ